LNVRYWMFFHSMLNVGSSMLEVHSVFRVCFFKNVNISWTSPSCVSHFSIKLSRERKGNKSTQSTTSPICCIVHCCCLLGHKVIIDKHQRYPALGEEDN
jgi:hypothetical protein